MSRTPRRTHSESATHVGRPSRGTAGTRGGKGCAAAISSPRDGRAAFAEGSRAGTPGPAHARRANASALPTASHRSRRAVRHHLTPGSARPTHPAGAVTRRRAVECQPHPPARRRLSTHHRANRTARAARAGAAGKPTPLQSPPHRPAPTAPHRPRWRGRQTDPRPTAPRQQHQPTPHRPAPTHTAPHRPLARPTSRPPSDCTAPSANPHRTARRQPTLHRAAGRQPTPHRAVRAGATGKPASVRPHRAARAGAVAGRVFVRRRVARCVPPLGRDRRHARAVHASFAVRRLSHATPPDRCRPSRRTSSSTDRTAAGVARAVRVPHQLTPSSNENLLRQLLRA